MKMSMFRRILFLAPIAIAAMQSSFAAAPSVTAVLSDSQPAVGQMVRLEIKVNGANSANVPETISIDGLEIHQTGTSRQFEMHNFDVTSSVTYNYTILPLKAGNFKIPPQAVRGTILQVLASDSGTLNRMNIVSGSQGRLQNLEQLVSVLNRERRNNRLYVTLLGPSPTMVVQDKVMPNVPASQINLLDQRGGPASSLVVRQSAAGEWSVPLEQVVQGSSSITIRIK